MSSKYFNLLLRGFTTLSRFLLVLYISSFFSLSELGVYGIFFTSITILVLILGLDFYLFNAREILSVHQSKRAVFIYNQFFLHILTYIFVLPLVVIIFYMNILPFSYMIWFYAILVSEHISQELYRLYTTLSKPLFANFLLFIRTAAWIYILLFIWAFDHNKIYHHLLIVWQMWFLGSLISVLLGVFQLHKILELKNISWDQINFPWVKQGIKMSLIFFLSTIMMKIIEFSDRYMIQFWLSDEDVGIYTFYANFVNVAQTIVFTLVVMVYVPNLIEYANKNLIDRYKVNKTIFNTKLITVSITSFFLTLIGTIVVVYVIQENKLWTNITTFLILNISMLVQNALLIYYYELYCFHKEKKILLSTTYGAFVNIILNLILIKIYGILGASLATLISICLIFGLQYYFIKVKSND